MGIRAPRRDILLDHDPFDRQTYLGDAVAWPPCTVFAAPLSRIPFAFGCDRCFRIDPSRCARKPLPGVDHGPSGFALILVTAMALPCVQRQRSRRRKPAQNDAMAGNTQFLIFGMKPGGIMRCDRMDRSTGIPSRVPTVASTATTASWRGPLHLYPDRRAAGRTLDRLRGHGHHRLRGSIVGRAGRRRNTSPTSFVASAASSPTPRM